MAHAAGMQLNGLHAGGFLNLDRIDIAVDIRFHDGNTDFVFKTIDGLNEGSGLAASGRRHQIEQKHALGLQLTAQLIRRTVVILEDTLLNLDNFNVFHGINFYLFRNRLQNYNFFLIYARLHIFFCIINLWHDFCSILFENILTYKNELL